MMMQEWIVAAIVACSAWAVLMRYAPLPVRRGLRGLAARACKRIGLTGMAAKLADANTGASSCADGCGSCGGCGPSTSAQAGTSLEKLKQTARR
jgi:hypothetical protein